MKRNLYVYYRAAEADAPEVQRRVSAMQQGLRDRYGIVAALMRRPESKDGRHTWMETYEAAPPGFEQVLDDAYAQSDVAGIIEGPRHTEIFLEVSSCA